MAGEPAITAVPVHRVTSDGDVVAGIDGLAAEEPLEIRLGFVAEGKATHKSISITMRTPGADLDLAAGFLVTEGLITSAEQIQQIRHCGIRAPSSLTVELAREYAMTLLGFVRDHRFNIYTGPERVVGRGVAGSAGSRTVLGG